jgi:ParB-like chromosome segregation protein Spo0J
MTTTTKTTTPRESHPYASFFPPMDQSALAELAADIAAHGLREPIWLHRDGRILDGRIRYAACELAGVELECRTWSGDDSDLIAFVISLNLHRRHLNESQRAMIAAKIATLEKGLDQDKTVRVGVLARVSAGNVVSRTARGSQRPRLRHDVVEAVASQVEL